jgi:hypothetical protein
MAQIPSNQIGIIRDAQSNVLAMRLQEVEVCEYWSVIFSAKGVDTLTKQDMTGFLSFQQNRRWREISKEDVTADMPRLRASLGILINNDIAIDVRLDLLEPGRGSAAVPHLGKAKLTPVLMVTNPRQYGVWNDYSERALRGMGLFPAFAPGDHLGAQYLAVNQVLAGLAAEYHLSLWRLDIILEQLARTVR